MNYFKFQFSLVLTNEQVRAMIVRALRETPYGRLTCALSEAMLHYEPDAIVGLLTDVQCNAIVEKFVLPFVHHTAVFEEYNSITALPRHLSEDKRCALFLHVDKLLCKRFTKPSLKLKKRAMDKPFRVGDVVSVYGESGRLHGGALVITEVSCNDGLFEYMTNEGGWVSHVRCTLVRECDADSLAVVQQYFADVDEEEDEDEE